MAPTTTGITVRDEVQTNPGLTRLLLGLMFALHPAVHGAHLTYRDQAANTVFPHQPRRAVQAISSGFKQSPNYFLLF